MNYLNTAMNDAKESSDLMTLGRQDFRQHYSAESAAGEASMHWTSLEPGLREMILAVVDQRGGHDRVGRKSEFFDDVVTELGLRGVARPASFAAQTALTFKTMFRCTLLILGKAPKTDWN
jgi:hypothetical protein